MCLTLCGVGLILHCYLVAVTEEATVTQLTETVQALHITDVEESFGGIVNIQLHCMTSY